MIITTEEFKKLPMLEDGVSTDDLIQIYYNPHNATMFLVPISKWELFKKLAEELKQTKAIDSIKLNVISDNDLEDAARRKQFMENLNGF